MNGTPFSTDRDADNALCAAVEMMRKLAEFNARRERDGKPAIDIGIGLNTAELPGRLLQVAHPLLQLLVGGLSLQRPAETDLNRG